MLCFKIKDRTISNVRNFKTYINSNLSQTYRSYLHCSTCGTVYNTILKNILFIWLTIFLTQYYSPQKTRSAEIDFVLEAISAIPSP